MKGSVILNNLEENTDNVIRDINFNQPRLKLAGSNPTGEDWLRNLPEGSIFLARIKANNNNKDLFLTKYMIVKHFKVTSELYTLTPAGQQITLDTPSLEFSRKNELVEVIGEALLINEEEKNEVSHEEEHSHGDVEENSGGSQGETPSA